MTDLEKVRLCAEAMGYSALRYSQGVVQQSSSSGIYVVDKADQRGYKEYDPLTDDAQAMALVKRFGLHIYINSFIEPNTWVVSSKVGVAGEDTDLNRAIVSAVAALQAANRGKE